MEAHGYNNRKGNGTVMKTKWNENKNAMER